MFLQLDLFQSVLLLVFASMFLVQLFYFFFFYIRLAFIKKVPAKKELQPVSVIICARNEEENLKNNLPKILDQDYPDFEVVVVNDRSLDGSDDVLRSFEKQYKNLKTTRISEGQQFDQGKKLAVTVGIKAAKNEILLFIDADCEPASKNWIKAMASKYEDKTEIVLGYGQYKKDKSFLNSIIRFDTVSIAMNYLSLGLAGVPYMGVGRNLSYKKSLFLKNKGFAGHYHLLSGDDDLLINATATKQNTKVEVSKESITVSEPKKDFGSWLNQKKRHLTTGKYYKTKHKLLLGLEPFSKFIFYVCFILLLIFCDLKIEVLSIFAARLILFITIFKIAMRRLNEKDLLLFSPMYELILPIFYIFIDISNRLTGKISKWK